MPRCFKLILILCLLVGCSQTPEIPPLSNEKKGPVNQIVLSDSLSVADFRRVFSVLNEKGRLSAVQIWFNALSDSELVSLSSLASKWIYEDAFNPEGVVALVKSRNLNRGFSLWSTHLSNWSRSSTHELERRFLTHYLNQEESFRFVRNDIKLLSPGFYSALSRTQSLYNLVTPTKAIFPKAEAIKETEIASDILQLFQKNNSLFSEFGNKLQSSRFIPNLLQGLHTVYGRHRGRAALDGFTLGITSRLENHQFERLLSLLETLNSPTDGLFTHLQNKLNENPATIQILSERLKPTLSRAEAIEVLKTLQFDSQFWKSLPRKSQELAPTPEFIQLFRTVRRSLDVFVSKNAHPGFSKPSVYLSSYLISLWLEQLAKANITIFETETLKTATFQVPLFTVVLGEESLSNSTKLDLTTLGGLESFIDYLSLLLKEKTFARRIVFEETKGSVEHSLGRAFESVNAVHPLCDPGPYFLAMASNFFSADPNTLSLETFESKNMLGSINKFLRGLDYTSWLPLRNFFFEKLSLGELSENDRNLILELYADKPDSLEKLTSLFDNAQMIYEFDLPVQGLPSSFETYHAVIENTRPKELPFVADLLSMIHKTEIVRIDPDTNKPFFPSLYGSISSAIGLSNFLTFFSVATEEDHIPLADFLETPFKVDFGKRLSWLGETAQLDPDSIRHALGLLIQGGWSLLPDLSTLTPTERNWIIRFSESPDFTELLKILQRHSSESSLYKVTNELLSMVEDGSLKEGLEFLGRLENDRIKEIARVGLKLIESGQLKEILRSLQLLAQH